MRLLIVVAGYLLVSEVLSSSWVIADKIMNRTTPFSRSSRWRDKLWQRQLIIRISLVGMAAIPLVILTTVLFTSQSQTQTYKGLNKAQNQALENLGDCSQETDVRLVLTMRSLDSAHQTADADASLCIGDQVLSNLVIKRTGAHLLSDSLSTSGLSADFLKASFGVYYVGTTPAASLDRTATIHSILDQAFVARYPVDLGIVSIPLYGSATSYPLDSYSAAGIWVFKLPDGIAISGPSSNPHAGETGWVISPEIAATPNADNVAWFGDRDFGTIEAVRVFSVQIFVLLISSLPLILFSGLLVLVSPILSNQSHHRFPAELLVGVGAFLVAIFPIRAVLIPSDISQITIIDYILGSEMAVIVAASLMIVLAGATGQAEGSPRNPEEGTAPISTADAGVTVSPIEALGQRGHNSAVDDSGVATVAARNSNRSVSFFLFGLAGILMIRKLLKRKRKHD